MDSTDFEIPSPKRQKTESPVDRRMEDVLPKQSAAVESVAQGLNDNQPPSYTSTAEKPLTSQPEGSTKEERDVLDVLMQHVESETAEIQNLDRNETVAEPTTASGLEPMRPQQTPSDPHVTDSLITHPADHTETFPTTNEVQQNQTTVTLSRVDEQVTEAQPPLNEPQAEELLRTVTEVNGEPVNELVPSNSPPEQPASEAREWETDSSPIDSSSDTDSSDSSDSGDSDDADEYTLLDPYEQARILMAEDGGGGGGSDDDEDGTTNRPARPGAGLRTTNEKMEDILPKPDITVTDEMHVEELGTVEATVENTLLIRAKTSGEYQVLESGSVLCLADRSIVGAVAETLGRVEQPLYTVRFASHNEIEESGLSEKGTKIYYVREHSTFVFTQPLQAVKGSDASNFHDEEVGDDEMEFSDDEAEAEHKRQMKLRRKGIDPDTVPNGARGRGRGRDRGGRGGRNPSSRGGYNGGHRNGAYETVGNSHATDVAMNYDDVEQGETSYTPLKRPDVMAAPGAMSPPQMNANMPSYQQNSPRGGFDRNQQRGRGRGNFNNRGRGRGNYNSYNNSSPMSPPIQQQYSPPNVQNQFQYQNYPAGYNQQPSNFAFQPPPPPALTPTHQNTYPNIAFSPSPITPLPGSSFNFPPFPNYNMNQWPQNQQSPTQQYPYGANNNAEAIAQVQRQLEELRRYGAQQ